MNNQTSKKIALSVLHALFKPSDVKKLSKSKAVVLAGYPGCGKTTIAGLLDRAYGFQRFSTDGIRIKEYKQKHRMGDHDLVMLTRYFVYEELTKKIISALKKDEKVVVDGTNMDDKRLGIIGGILSQVPLKKMLMVVIRPPEWVLKGRFSHLEAEDYKNWWKVYRYWKKEVKEGKAAFPTKKRLPQIQIIKPKRYAIRTFDWVVDIKGIIWDMDGTLYKDIPALRDFIDKQFIEKFAEVEELERRKAKRDFFERYKKLGSRTRVMNEIGVDGKEFIQNELERKIDFADFLEPDIKMRRLLKKLSDLKHFIFTNTSSYGTKKKLAALGISKKRFDGIYCTHDMRWLKPDIRAYKWVAKKTGLKPGQLLSVGDREKTDIVPSQDVGMRTCMVYGTSRIADVSLRNHYEVAELFGKEI